MSTREWIESPLLSDKVATYSPVLDSTAERLEEQFASFCSIYGAGSWQESQFRKGYAESLRWRSDGSRFVCSISYARVAGADGAVITPDNYLLSDVSVDFPTVVGGSHDYHSFGSRVDCQATKQLDGTAVVLALLGGNNYFHWTMQALPRVFLLEKVGIELDEVDHFIVNGDNHRFQRETLQLVGIPSGRIVVLGPDEVVRCAQLLVPSVPPCTNFVFESDRKQVVQRLGLVRQDKPEARARLYFPRRAVSHRRVINEDAIEEVVRARGFAIVEPSEMSVSEQAALFASAEIIVSPHGAGLTNLAFAPSCASVVEIFDPSFVNGCFARLSWISGLRYSFVFGAGLGPPILGRQLDVAAVRAEPAAHVSDESAWENSDILADLDALELTLESAGA